MTLVLCIIAGVLLGWVIGFLQGLNYKHFKEDSE